MIRKGPAPTNIDAYKAGFSKEIQAMLEQLRTTIHKAAPEAEEVISYNIPTFKLKGILVHFGAFKNHIGFYPTSSATKIFEKELSAYDGGKGTVRFPVDKPLPLALIKKIVQFRVMENLEKASIKNMAKKLAKVNSFRK